MLGRFTALRVNGRRRLLDTSGSLLEHLVTRQLVPTRYDHEDGKSVQHDLLGMLRLVTRMYEMEHRTHPMNTNNYDARATVHVESSLM